MELDYKPSDDFIVNNIRPLDIDLTGSKELWLIQCPFSYYPELEGKVLKVDLEKDGNLGGFKDSSGKDVELVSFASQDADALVILPTNHESEIVGKISRRVSLVTYPEPKDLLKTMKAKTKQKHVAVVAETAAKLAQSSRRKSGQSKSTFQNSSATRSTRPTSTVSGFTETPKSTKRTHSGTSSGKHSTLTDQSVKSKKKAKTEK